MKSVWQWAVLLTLVRHVSKSTGNQPAYQVTLLVQFFPKAPPLRICNGAIVQSRLVVTAASCLYHQFDADGAVVAIPLNAMRVVAGSDDLYAEDPVFRVSAVHISDSFKPSTLENDLAVLQLSSPLPLAERNDMKWIILNDDQIDDSTSCLTNFRYENPNDDSILDYAQTEELQIVDPEECKMSHVRKGDICTYYTLPTGIDCNNPDANFARGTGLVCNSRLVAVLSTILHATEDSAETSCSEVPLKAFHTRLVPHLGWIYRIIAEEEFVNLMHGNLTVSSPYQHKSDAIKQHDTSEATPDFNKILSTDTADVPDVELGHTSFANLHLPNSGRRTQSLRSLIWTMLLFVVTHPVIYIFFCTDHTSSLQPNPIDLTPIPSFRRKSDRPKFPRSYIH